MTVQRPPSEPVSAPPASVTGASHPTWTTALLDDLLTNTLDPGYRAAAESQRKSHRWDRPMVWIGCLAVGLLLVVAYQQNHRSAPAREAASHDLITRIHSLQAAGTKMDSQAKSLAAEVAALRDAQLSAVGDPGLKNLEISSGSVAVSGPGVSIELGEPAAPVSSASNGRDGTGNQQQGALIHDVQVRDVVNQLWNSGAEAIAVNGIRLTATSAIRFAGESILVDFQTINTPYTIDAVGDRNGMLLAFADSPIARALKTAQQVQGITFKFDGKSGLKLPAATVVKQQYASPGLSTAEPASGAAPTNAVDGKSGAPRGSAGTATGSGTNGGDPNKVTPHDSPSNPSSRETHQ